MEKLIIWLAIALISSTFAVYTAFLALASAKRLRDAGVPIPWDMRAVCWFWYVVGWPADVLFNWLRGTWMYRESPREFTFSARVQRHYRKTGGKRKDKANEWAALLTGADPGHIK